jgi:hypothetical protein
MNNRSLGYNIGDVVKIPLLAENTSGTDVDPGTLTLTIKAPGIAAVVYTYGVDSEIVRTAAGIFYLLYTTTTAGKHYYRWNGTGSNAGTLQGHFYVKANQF